MDSTLPAQPTTMIPSVPNTSADHLVMAKKKRNIILGSVMGGLVVVIVAIVLIYLFVFRPRVYYGNHILITTMQTPGSCTDQTIMPPPQGSVNQKTLKLQPTYNCRNATTKNATGQSVRAPNLMPSGPLTRYTMISRSLQPYASVGCAPNIRMPCMLVTPKLERHGLVHEGDAFMIWEPINNMYLFQVDCSLYSSKNTCVPNQANTEPFGLCSMPDKTCTLQGNAVPLIFRPLPDDFKQQMADAKNHPTIQGFLFSFASKKPTKNMLRIQTNYILTSLVSNNLVQFNVNDNRMTLQPTSAQIDDTFNWQILKE
jgi:hypothetical protein